ncbi:MAG TPA: hypothetical protein VMZ53_20805 [Kofleriaceae bacterium]|nr:hypothetical protein [Kofleriaceae bacterium]
MTAADATCGSEAAAAGLPGTFVAFLTSSSVPDVRARFAGSRGWVLVDGTPVGTTMDAMLDQYAVLNAVDMLADGSRFASNQSAWTGMLEDGKVDTTATCNDWTTSSAAASGQGNVLRNATLAFGNPLPCDMPRHLICFEVGHRAEVAPIVSSGRLAFLTVAKRTPSTNVAAADALCNAEATAAGFPGTYLAALNTSTASIASRFVVDQRPWVRVDGTLASDPSAILTGGLLRSFVHQASDGSYVRRGFYTGVSSTPNVTSAQTCMDWTSGNAMTNVPIGLPPHILGSQFWSWSTSGCDAQLSVLCMQQ